MTTGGHKNISVHLCCLVLNFFHLDVFRGDVNDCNNYDDDDDDEGDNDNDEDIDDEDDEGGDDKEDGDDEEGGEHPLSFSLSSISPGCACCPPYTTLLRSILIIIMLIMISTMIMITTMVLVVAMNWIII